MFMVLPMVPMVYQCVCSRFYQWYQWYYNTVQGSTNGAIGYTIGTNGNANGTIGSPNGSIDKICINLLVPSRPGVIVIVNHDYL